MQINARSIINAYKETQNAESINIFRNKSRGAKNKPKLNYHGKR